MNQEAPAKFRYIAFFDLLADAVFLHQKANIEPNPYLSSRFARGSISASSLSTECFANCLLTILQPTRSLANDLDKLPPLSKIDVALRLQGSKALDRGRIEVQRVAELIQARNDYVHPKASAVEASISTPQDAENEWVLPVSMNAELWRGLEIPKPAMFWSKENSLSTLSAICLFFRYVIVDLMNGDEDLINEFFISRVEFGNIQMPGVYDEFRELLQSASKFGLDFTFLNIQNNNFNP